MSKNILVLLDSNPDQISATSWECLSLAQNLAEEIDSRIQAMVFGSLDDQPLERLCTIELESIVQITNPELNTYSPEYFGESLKLVIEEISPDIILMPHSYQNMDWIPRVAAKCNLGLITDCTGYKVSTNELVFCRQMFRNKLNIDLKIDASKPWLVTVQSGADSADNLKTGSCQSIQKTLDLSNVSSSRRVIETVEATKGKVDLSKAEIIIGVGRGIKKQENLQLVRELAEVLNAELGASRPVVDSEWLERERQIGSSGQNVSPKLYIAVGISGAIQHVVGIRNSDCIVAINSDPHAPIFNVATYGVLGDLQEVVPALTKALKNEGDRG